jgi:hypothetical protein
VKLEWDGDTPLADAEVIAGMYGVSKRTVRRHCAPVRSARPAGPGSCQALYDAYAAADDLGGVTPRPERTLAAMRVQLARERARAR